MRRYKFRPRHREPAFLDTPRSVATVFICSFGGLVILVIQELLRHH